MVKPTRHIVTPIKGLWNSKRKVWFQKNDDGDDEFKECKRCGGSGNIPHPTKWEEGEQITCPICKGRGWARQ
jgi:DnaJ-class molecular chaperone